MYIKKGENGHQIDYWVKESTEEPQMKTTKEWFIRLFDKQKALPTTIDNYAYVRLIELHRTSHSWTERSSFYYFIETRGVQRENSMTRAKPRL